MLLFGEKTVLLVGGLAHDVVVLVDEEHHGVMRLGLLGSHGEIVVRPEAILIADEGMLPCKVELSCFMGSYQNYHVRVGDTLVKITDNCPINKRVFDVGENAFISFKKECAHLL